MRFLVRPRPSFVNLLEDGQWMKEMHERFRILSELHMLSQDRIFLVVPTTSDLRNLPKCLPHMAYLFVEEQ